MTTNQALVDPQLQLPKSSTRRLISINYFRTRTVLLGTDFAGSPTPAAQEMLNNPYWTGRVVQGLVEVAAGKRISLDEYLSNPG